ncbi:MAG: nodulation protein NfeD [Acidilobaceae archaeon]
MMRTSAALLVSLVFLSLLAPHLAQETELEDRKAIVDNDDLGLMYCGHITKKMGIVEEDVEADDSVGPHVIVAKIEGVIGEWAQRYVERVLALAESKRSVLVLELETPGGLLEPSLSIANSISRAKVPVVTYGRGKWVESAGALILVSGHIAVLAPGTITGSLQPVRIDPQRGYVPINDTKTINPIIKALCEHGASKGRNATALIRMVLNNANYGAEEAVTIGLTEFSAKSREELLLLINGLKVRLYDGRVVKIITTEDYEEVSPSLSENLLRGLSDPLLSGVLLSIGVLALIFSVANSNPLGIVLGLALVLLGLLGYGFSASFVSLSLIGLGAILLVAELLTPGFGLMGATGIVLMSIGIALVPVTSGFAVSQAYLSQLFVTLLIISIVLGLGAVFVIYKIVQAQKHEPVIGRIMGAVGIALDDIPPGEEGFALIEGEYWKVRSDQRISRGDKVLVVGKEGPRLIVKPVREEK